MSKEFEYAETVLRYLTGSTKPAVVGRDVTWTGEELLARAYGAADWMRSHGATSGHPVPALLVTSPVAVALVVGGALTDLPLAPLNPRGGVAELAEIVGERLNAAVLLVDPSALEVGREVAQRVPGLSVAVVPADFTPNPAGVFAPGPNAMILHTSGTSGLPKTVPAAQDRLIPRGLAYAELGDIHPGDSFCSASTFQHVAGSAMALVSLGLGGSVITIPWFSVENWRWLQTAHPTHVLLVPTMIDQLLEHDLLDIGMRVIIYGASPIPPALLAAAVKAAPSVSFVQVFGQTEGSPLTALRHSDHLAALAGNEQLLTSIGRALPSVQARLREVEDGVGEVMVKADHLLRRDEEGWLDTGDLGQIDDEGYIYLRGRKGDMIIRGGENVYPLEVERVLDTHPGVLESAVLGLPDPRLGQTICAVVVPADPAAPPSEDELTEYAGGRIAKIKIPTTWRFVEALPRSATGKVLRTALVDAS